MTLYQKLLIAAIYVLGFDTPTDITFEHGTHQYSVYNYIEKSRSGLDVGVEFAVDDEGGEDYLYDDLWWEIRRDNRVNRERLHEACKAMVAAEARGFTE